MENVSALLIIAKIVYEELNIVMVILIVGTVLILSIIKIDRFISFYIYI